jgi:hypothetical protein
MGQEAILPSGNKRALLGLFRGPPKLFTFSSNFRSMIPTFGLGAKRYCRASLARRTALPERGGPLVPRWRKQHESPDGRSSARCKPLVSDARPEAFDPLDPALGDDGCRLRPPSGSADACCAISIACRTISIACCRTISLTDLPARERGARAATAARLRVQGIRPPDRGSLAICPAEGGLRAAVLSARGESRTPTPKAATGIERVLGHPSAFDHRHFMVNNL